jgi:glycosyltransferase involved in cell wall biosynthesis
MTNFKACTFAGVVVEPQTKIGEMKKLCFVATIPAAVYAFLRGHIRASAKKWPVKIISNPFGAELLSDLDAQFIPLAIERKPSPRRDLLALIQLVILFRHERFDLVHSIMPKSGLLSMLAACLAGVPHRMHTFTGQVWANKRGWKRCVLKMFDKLIVSFATHILVDSLSQLDFLVSEGILTQGKGMVIGHGSICGVDPDRFYPDAQTKSIVRQELGINQNATVLLFLGRLNRDKGILDLADAFAEISRHKPEAVLLLVGAEEEVPFARIQEICGAGRNQLRRVSFTPNPERYMATADIFCLPSYREGFGQVIIEAASSGMPAVASRIYGITDAVEEGKTGLLFPAGNVAVLTKTLLMLIEDQALRQKMGVAARLRALELFASENITRELVDLYAEVMASP